jgi:hypothetical protein
LNPQAENSGEKLLTRVTVNAGSCGYDVTIEIEKLDRQTVCVRLRSDCEQIAAMNPDLAQLGWRRGVFCKIAESRIYQSAAQHVKHAACPVPSAILKAIEVEVGIALPRDVRIHFEMPVRAEVSETLRTTGEDQ